MVVGATGNAGTSLLQTLAGEPAVDSVVGIARRRPELQFAKTDWATADIAESGLAALFHGADAVVHLAWLIQPSRDKNLLWRVNVDGSTRVFRAVVEAGVGTLVYASSVGVYSPGPKDRRVDESWPRDGVRTNEYSLQKAEVERRLDRFEREQPEVRVVRLRPALIFKRESAAEQRRLFAGPFLPGSLIRPGLIPFVPEIPELVTQAVHSYDVGDAYRLAVVNDGARGAFNVASEPELDLTTFAKLLRARTFRMSASTARALAAIAWRLRLTPIPPSWLDMGLASPLLDSTRARAELGWEPQYSSERAVADLLDGMRHSAGLETPPLSPRTSGPARIRELATGIGKRP
ncbi:MAG: NAD-dependent epimerase/dehydratase family protein [Gaiellaceae bacterium]